MSTRQTRLMDILQRFDGDGMTSEEFRSPAENGLNFCAISEMKVHIEEALGLEFADSSFDLNRFVTLGNFLAFAEGISSLPDRVSPAE